MNNQRASYIKYVTLTSLALSLTLSACTPAGQETKPSASPTVSETQAASPPTVKPNATGSSTPTATKTPTPTVVTPAPVKSDSVTEPIRATPVPAPPNAQKLKTFTFSDGHISFDYPANWTVKTTQGPYITADKKANAFKAVISDEEGDVVAYISSGTEGGATGGPVIRTILDSQAVPAFPTKDGASHFVFFQDDFPFGGQSSYFMGVVTDNYMEEGHTASVNSFLRVENGLAAAVVEFDSPAFKSPDSARQWMKTEQYSQLKAMMTSLRYS